MYRYGREEMTSALSPGSGARTDFRERKEKKRRMCYNWCNQFMQSFFMSGIGKRLPGKIREAQGRQRKHIPFSGPLFA